ncbi:MAG: ABC transporter permease [Rhodospirillales bacterium]|nr:ABC transporter permease [Rhodospirillales bacterium]
MPQAAAESNAANLVYSQPTAGTLTLHFVGDWRLRHQPPTKDGALKKLAEAAELKRVRFDADKVTAWDSALVSFLMAVDNACRERGIEVDAEALPDGARRLLNLALAVPEKAGARKAAASTPFLARLGKGWLALVADAKATVGFLGAVTLGFSRLIRGRARLRGSDVLLLIQECGPNALMIIALISLLVGISTAFIGAIQLQKFGTEIFVANLIGLSMVRQMAASMTAFVMAGRTGAAYAAQIGTMQVNQEIDALETLGISPIDFLVLPRIIAMVVMMPFLYFFSNVAGILGGMLVAQVMLNISPVAFYFQLVSALSIKDFVIGVLMAIVFGALVAFYGCLRGIQCGRSAASVGLAATSAVVGAIVAIIVANFIFSVVTTTLGL